MRLAILKDMNRLSYDQLICKVPTRNGTRIFGRQRLVRNQKIVRHLLKEWADRVLTSDKIITYKEGSKRDRTVFL